MDLDQYRKKWELDEHWQLRKLFIETYLDEYPIEKLLCYSQLFLNIETLGVTYDKECMELIEQLASKLDFLKEYRAKRKKAIEDSYTKFKNIETEKRAFKRAKYESSSYHSQQNTQPNQYNQSYYQSHQRSNHQPYHQTHHQSYYNHYHQPHSSQFSHSYYHQQSNYNYPDDHSNQSNYNNHQHQKFGKHPSQSNSRTSSRPYYGQQQRPYSNSRY